MISNFNWIDVKDRCNYFVDASYRHLNFNKIHKKSVFSIVFDQHLAAQHKNTGWNTQQATVHETGGGLTSFVPTVNVSSFSLNKCSLVKSLNGRSRQKIRRLHHHHSFFSILLSWRLFVPESLLSSSCSGSALTRTLPVFFTTLLARPLGPKAAALYTVK